MNKIFLSKVIEKLSIIAEEEKFDEKQIQKGVDIEKEHKKTIEGIIDDAKNDKVKSLSDYYKGIALDHLSEVGNYYVDSNGQSRLDKLENEAKSEAKEEPKDVKSAAKKDPEVKEAEDLLKDLEKISSKIIQSGNELRDLTAIRGKDMSQWRRQKGVSSEKVKAWVEELHKQGFINASLDKASTAIVKIEREIKKFLGK